jgi:hypothetical protein
MLLAAPLTPAPFAGAPARTLAALTLSLSPDRLGARSSLAFTISYSGGEAGVPAPVRRLVLRFPAGLGLDVPDLRTCSAARLRSHGARGCPSQSAIGAGRALLETRTGPQPLTENVSLQAFIGPPRNLEPTLEILGQGYTPLDERVVFTGITLPDRAPYGERLVMALPPIPTLPLEPDASIVDFSLRIGTRAPRAGANAVIVPARCPAGGFPFAAEFTYADGSTGTALTTAPCPS